MPKDVKIFVKFCPSLVCNGAPRKFTPAVYVEEKSPHMHQDVIGPQSHGHIGTYAKRHVLPLAYCEVCKTVIFVGPTPQEVERKIEKKNQKAAKESERNSFKGLGNLATDEEWGKMLRTRTRRPGKLDPDKKKKKTGALA